MNQKVTRYSQGLFSVSDATSITNTINIIIDVIIKIGASYWNCTNRRVLTKNLFRSQNLRGIIKMVQEVRFELTEPFGKSL